MRRIIEELLRQQAERERQLLASQARIGTARKGRKWLLIVVSSIKLDHLSSTTVS
jgi:hypothetical protein